MWRRAVRAFSADAPLHTCQPPASRAAYQPLASRAVRPPMLPIAVVRACASGIFMLAGLQATTAAVVVLRPPCPVGVACMQARRAGNTAE